MSEGPRATERRATHRRRRAVLATLGLAGLVGLVVALLLFEPWTLLTDEVVDEAAPVASAPSLPGPAPTAIPSAESPPPVVPVVPVVLASGSFISHEHATSGDVRVLQLSDGSRVLRIDGLDTSNGPDLHVWLTDAPVVAGRDGWFVFDDGAHVELGMLKGNRGNQNYALPAEVDLDQLSSVTIWCRRFHVSFGAAQLT